MHHSYTPRATCVHQGPLIIGAATTQRVEDFERHTAPPSERTHCHYSYYAQWSHQRDEERAYNVATYRNP